MPEDICGKCNRSIVTANRRFRCTKCQTNFCPSCMDRFCLFCRGPVQEAAKPA